MLLALFLVYGLMVVFYLFFITVNCFSSFIQLYVSGTLNDIFVIS